MDADAIRAEAIDRLARMQFELDEPSNREEYDDWAPQYRREVTKFVDALGDLLPIGVEEERVQVFGIHGEIGTRIPSRRRFVCDWQELHE